MRSKLPLLLATALVAAVVVLSVAVVPAHTPSRVVNGISPQLQSIGALAVGPRGTLYVADPQAASIYALDLSAQHAGAPGTKDVASIDKEIASTLGTVPAEITITDLKVD